MRYLTARGLVVQQSGSISGSCRFIAEVAEEKQESADTISELFRDWSNYKEKIRPVLEFRLKQIPIIDNRLHKFVRRGLEDIPDDPDDCLNNLSKIEDYALDLIWNFEFGGESVPDEIVAYWTEPSRTNDNRVVQLIGPDQGKVSKDRLQQLLLLERLTGSRWKFESRSRFVSKDTYVLLSAIHQFRNRSEHADGQTIDVGVAVAALLLCIELLGCLARELGADSREND